MYGIFTYIWLNFMVNVGEYTIHGSYGYKFSLDLGQNLGAQRVHLNLGDLLEDKDKKHPSWYSTKTWRPREKLQNIIPQLPFLIDLLWQTRDVSRENVVWSQPN